jgi:hypothetical protein
MTMESREAIESKLADLHRERGFALLHGRKFDNRKIVDLHEVLAAFDDREAAQIEQGREDAATKHKAEITAQRTEIEDLKSASAKALAESRAGYMQGAAAMRLHLQTEVSLRKAQAKLNQLTGETTPLTNEFELHGKRALQIAAVGIRPITRHPSYFGSLSGKITYPNTLPDWKD